MKTASETRDSLPARTDIEEALLECAKCAMHALETGTYSRVEREQIIRDLAHAIEQFEVGA
jgi:hypothetical protein